MLIGVSRTPSVTGAGLHRQPVLGAVRCVAELWRSGVVFDCFKSAFSFLWCLMRCSHCKIPEF